ncbi:DUF4259 domain-containing protein [Paenibacillus tarimensis]
MGAWGHEIFNNDDVLDWTYELLETNGVLFLEETLQSVLEEEYIEADLACVGLGTAEFSLKTKSMC